MHKVGRGLIAVVACTLSLGAVGPPASAAPTFDTVQTLTGTSGQYIDAVRQRVNARGEAVVAWIETTDQQYLKLAFRPAGGVFGPVTELTTSDRSGFFDVALGDDGEALAVWVHGASGAFTASVVARPSGATSAWSAPRSVDVTGVDARTARLAIGSGGHAALLFATPVGRPGAVVRTRPPGGGTAFGDALPIAPAAGPSYLNPDLLAVGPDGTVTAVLTQSTSVQAATLAAGAAAFGPAQVLTAPGHTTTDGESSFSAADATGNVFVVVKRQRYDGSPCTSAATCHAQTSQIDGFFRPAGSGTSFGPATPIVAPAPALGGAYPFVDRGQIDVILTSNRDLAKADPDTVELLEGPAAGPFSRAPVGDSGGDPTWDGVAGALSIARTSASGVTVESRPTSGGAFSAPVPTAAAIADAGLTLIDLGAPDNGQLFVYANTLSAPAFRVAYDGPVKDTSAPQVFTGGASRVAPTEPQKIGSDNEVDVPVSCSEACTMTGSGTVSIDGGAASVLRLGSRTARLKVAQRLTLGVPVPRAVRAQIATALRRGRRVTARMRLRAVDAKGNARTRTLPIRLKR